MDAFVFMLIIVVPLILALLGFMGTRAGWAIFPTFGVIVGGLGTLVLYVDGDLTSGSVILASANGNFISDMNFVESIPLVMTLACFYVAARRIFD